MDRFFVSDVHLFPEPEHHPGRDAFHSFLGHLAGSYEEGELWILGDLFDYWFEYRSVMPSGFQRCLCLIRELTERGWDVHFLPGNHDYWTGGHLERSTRMIIHSAEPVELEAGNRRVLLAHGDGLGPGDLGYRLIKPILRSRASIIMFRLLHPDLATWLARRFSDTSKRILRRDLDHIPEGLTAWVDEKFDEGFDLVITGHTHLDDIVRRENGIYVSLGDWLTRYTYCRLPGNGDEPELLEYQHPAGSRPIEAE